jgi:hypothetical protein
MSELSRRQTTSCASTSSSSVWPASALRGRRDTAIGRHLLVRRQRGFTQRDHCDDAERGTDGHEQNEDELLHFP